MTNAKNRKQQRCGPRGPSKVLENETTGHALYISGEHHAQNLDAMQAASGHGHRPMRRQCRGSLPAAFQYFLVKLEDNAGANVGRWLPKAANFIAAGLERGSVLVHCKAGICRSTTMILAYLIKFQQHSVSSALSLVREARQCVNPRREFLIALEAYAQAQASDWRDLEEEGEQLHTLRRELEGEDGASVSVEEDGRDRRVDMRVINKHFPIHLEAIKPRLLRRLGHAKLCGQLGGLRGCRRRQIVLKPAERLALDTCSAAACSRSRSWRPTWSRSRRRRSPRGASNDQTRRSAASNRR